MTSAKVVKKKRYPVRPRLRCDPNPYAGLRYAIGTIRNWNHSGYWGILRTNRTAQFSLFSRPSTVARRPPIQVSTVAGLLQSLHWNEEVWHQAHIPQHG